MHGELFPQTALLQLPLLVLLLLLPLLLLLLLLLSLLRVVMQLQQLHRAASLQRLVPLRPGPLYQAFAYFVHRRVRAQRLHPML